MDFIKAGGIRFNKGANSIEIVCEPLNILQAEQYFTTFDFYQAQYGVYSQLKLTSLQKYKATTVGTHAYLWKPLQGCTWNPSGSISFSSKEFEPCAAELQQEWCEWDILADCYKHLFSFNSKSGGLNEEGKKYLNMLVDLVNRNAMIGAVNTLTAGGLFTGITSASFIANTPTEIQNAFMATSNTCKGWITLLVELGALPDFAHCDITDLFTATDYNTSGKYIGNVIDLYQKIFDSAKPQLSSLIVEGGMDATPLFLVSPDVHARVAAQYTDQCVSITCIDPRLTKETITRGNRTFNVYFIDGIPVIPVSAAHRMAMHLTQKLSFAYLTVAGNIQLGTSFAPISFNQSEGVGLAIQKAMDIPNEGKYYMRGRALMSAYISDTDLISGGAFSYN